MWPTDFTRFLTCHPATPGPAVRTIEVHAERTAGGGLELAYRLRGDIARLRIPDPRQPGHCDGLWEHTCFEAFVAVAGEEAYHEFNFSPSGAWAAYVFTGYRRRDDRWTLLAAPELAARLSAGRVELEVLIPTSLLPALPVAVTWQIGLCAVIEAADVVDGRHSYWALRHPVALPDFHHRGGFALELPPSGPVA